MLTTMRTWMPTGGGLRDEDWAGRHRLLTMLLGGTVAALTVYGALQDGLTRPWLITVLVVLPCVIAAVRLPGRRLPSIAVALGFTAACGGFVAMSHGLTEAHFTFFIVIGALALYRDWAPFGAFLVGVVLHHAVAGAIEVFAGLRQFEICTPFADPPLGASDNYVRSVARRVGADPARAILELASRVWKKSRGKWLPAMASSLRNGLLRAGTPAPVVSHLSWFALPSAHWMKNQAGPFLRDASGMP